LQEHTTKLKVIVEVVLKAMARSLNLEDNCYLEKYGERALMQARFNFFPPCPRPDRSLGLKPHADRSAITIVLQDKEVEGLQFLKDDQWFRFPIQLPHALLINVGDQSEVNYRFVSSSACIQFIYRTPSVDTFLKEKRR